MRAMRWLLVGLAVAGCAQAGPPNSIIGGLTDGGDTRPDADPRIDAGDPPRPDAATTDAPPQQVTLTQTVTGSISDGNSIACQPPIRGVTRPNSYYRVFALSDHGIATTLHVTEVAFAIESATGGAGPDQPATLNVGTYAVVPVGDTLDLRQIRPISSLPIRIPDGNLTRMAVPVTADIPATTNLIVELAIPADSQVENEFFIGTNTDGERKPGYLRAPTCRYVDPTTLQRVALDKELAEIDIILTVTGTM
jgi:hypothetical protein